MPTSDALPRRTTVSPLATNKVGCQCGRECEMPCFQRVGLTDQPCCAGCPPLPPTECDSVACDACGKDRTPYRTENVMVNGDVDDVFTFCFFCVKEAERTERAV